MRKFLILSFLIILGVANLAISQQSVKLLPAQYDLVYAGKASDTIGTVVATNWTYTINPNKGYDALFCNHQVSLHKTGSTFKAGVFFQGKYTNTDSTWTTISTATYYGTADSTINSVQFTNKSPFNFYRVLVADSSGTGRVNGLKSYYRK